MNRSLMVADRRGNLKVENRMKRLAISLRLHPYMNERTGKPEQ